jgi:PTH1 family peptidyl-tRNA hydrolase
MLLCIHMTHLVVGLGNPGEKYLHTRHNVGFLFVDTIVAGDEWQKSSAAEALYTKKDIGGHEVEFLKPQTFMNNSGLSVAFASKKHELKPEQVIVVCDDIDLPFGKIRIAKSRGSGGHNGLRSIEQHLGTNDFVRVRIGVSKTDDEGNVRKPTGGLFTSKKNAVANFVLKNFTPDEQKTLHDVFKTCREAVETIVQSGVEKAMNKYN